MTSSPIVSYRQPFHIFYSESSPAPQLPQSPCTSKKPSTEVPNPAILFLLPAYPKVSTIIYLPSYFFVSVYVGSPSSTMLRCAWQTNCLRDRVWELPTGDLGNQARGKPGTMSSSFLSGCGRVCLVALTTPGLHTCSMRVPRYIVIHNYLPPK